MNAGLNDSEALFTAQCEEQKCVCRKLLYYADPL